MVSKSSVSTHLPIFSINRPKKFIGDAQAWTDDLKSLRGVTIIADEDIVQGKLVIIEDSIYEITDFHKPHGGYNCFDTMSLKHKGDL